ncbi:MAG: hypothetical protein K5779_00900 [Saccharofermentans sp.]|nr:hypothetical protein [Saccharofermentans sp.]
MNEQRMIKTVNSLLLFASILIINGTTQIAFIHIEKTEEPEIIEVPESAKEEVEVPEVKVKKYINPMIAEALKLRNGYNGLEITYTVILTDYLGHYFITAYSDEETNSRETASGVEVHYSEDPFEPSTCAIDLNYGRFNDLYMIDNRVYIAEDTGAFRGLWIDCFVETMEEVRAWDTGYKAVYSVSYETRTSNNREVLHERFNHHLHCGSAGSRVPYRNHY